mmetsp:Transcript_21394/g.63954  ORF Transcript_21394/g.63954 Transcript_21394/m.63954 type:complete len:480 (+) Transcript_21394:320-1759(+)
MGQIPPCAARARLRRRRAAVRERAHAARRARARARGFGGRRRRRVPGPHGLFRGAGARRAHEPVLRVVPAVRGLRRGRASLALVQRRAGEPGHRGRVGSDRPLWHIPGLARAPAVLHLVRPRALPVRRPAGGRGLLVPAAGQRLGRRRAAAHGDVRGGGGPGAGRALLRARELWPELRAAPCYVSGLSYAGKYVPAMALAALRHDPAAGGAIDLRGVSVGDPAITFAREAPRHAAYLYELGLVDEAQRGDCERIMANATAQWRERGDCRAAFDLWNSVWNDDASGGAFLYRRWTGSANTEFALGPAPPSHFRAWLARHERALHVAGTPRAGRAAAFAEGGAVYEAFVDSGDFCEDAAPAYRELAEAGVDIVVYAGTLDPLLGAPIVAAAVDGMWGPAFGAAPRVPWRVAAGDAEPSGYARCFRPGQGRFCFVTVRNSGHEAPVYAPRAAYDLNERFLAGRDFGEPGRPARCEERHRGPA